MMSFADRSGWLVAGVHRAGWLHELNDLQRTTLENALAGLYKLAGVDFVECKTDRETPGESVEKILARLRGQGDI